MNVKYSKEQKEKARMLRLRGFSIPEIERELNIPRATVWRFVKDCNLSSFAKERIALRRGRNKELALKRREDANKFVEKLFKKEFSRREKLLLLFGLYWGEGTKKELALINSDPAMIKTFIYLLSELGVVKNRIKISIRLHDGQNVEMAKTFWLKYLNLDESSLVGVYIIPTGRKTKLYHGMCRVAVAKSIKEFLILKTALDELRDML